MPGTFTGTQAATPMLETAPRPELEAHQPRPAFPSSTNDFGCMVPFTFANRPMSGRIVERRVPGEVLAAGRRAV